MAMQWLTMPGTVWVPPSQPLNPRQCSKHWCERLHRHLNKRVKGRPGIRQFPIRRWRRATGRPNDTLTQKKSARAREREKAFRCAARYGLCDYLTRNPVYVLCACVRSTFMPIVLRCQMLFGCLMVSGHYNVIRISHRDYVAKHEVHLTLIFRFYLYSISETRLTGGIVLFNGSHKTLLINTVFVWSFARFYVYTLELDDGQQWDIHIYSGAVGCRIVIHFIRYAWTIWWWTNAFH